ncbi:spirocyclase AveC family protein [Mycolicibacterium sp. ELW1]|uniref:spirocyclase AveC family protein n=1 Tax=Mycobacteriaceae TaxID=1762 RepID=UPI0011EC464D|nr:spirocyclase AveC family protein [Mycobacterium sp. ELW1]QEN16433.1 spirocyclase, AveC family [Mycobacterium sp. ELW1]
MPITATGLVPPATLNPSGVWFFNWVIPIGGSILIVLAIADAVRRRRLTWGFLFLFNSLAVYWMETIGDWGQMLFYSPTFAEHHLLEWLPLKTPHDPLFMPFAYAMYWGVHALLVLWLSQWVASKFGWSMLKSMVILAIPVNYIWDFIVEGAATAMGWWTYDPGIGPVLEWSNGGRITLLWTVGIMCTWPNLIAYWAGKPPIRGLNHFERFCRLDRFTVPKPPPSSLSDPTGTVVGAVATMEARQTKQQQFDDYLNYEVTIPRWRFELMRLGAWFVVFQISFFVFLVLPLVIMRWATGAESPYIP